MLDHETHVKIADELHRAGIDRVPVPRLTARYPQMEIEDSYAVQRIWAERQVEAGRRKVGHKIGLTSKAMQDATGIDEPDYGVIFDDQVFESGHVYEWKKYTHPRIEMELAFVLKDELRGPGLNLMDVLRATEYVVPTLEVLDSRIEMAGRTITDTISDNAALGSLVIGGRPVGVHDVDLRWVAGILSRNEEIIETGVAAGVLNHPANGVHWLANRIAEHGDALEAGEIVLAGSFTRPMWVYEGDTVYADYGPLGTITCRFA
ncbi:2-oxo-hepta-3-ene-1,7-dioate hydratase [Micrococcus luteus]|uniref:2-keto-4-pentenoate hydratase n=1 Tax=Micrococcus luteus TaxID=1270 RepID=UPI001CA70EC7|nr:fumarylacetoacetate hydrolase family protein [Micrococcus luteus]QZY85193.1 2-oxo-hepta-3-ene-1,7-dioate hydratase [Micrococcus luteus]